MIIDTKVKSNMGDMLRQKRGYFGIGVLNPKADINIGTLWRSAYCFNAAFIFTIGHRYKHQPGDTSKAPRHIPLFEYKNIEHFIYNYPSNCDLIAIELAETARSLFTYTHPQRAIYLLGAEDYGIPEQLIERCNDCIKINMPHSLNVATMGSIVMYDRYLKDQFNK